MNDFKSPIVRGGLIIFGLIALGMVYIFVAENSERLKDPGIWLYLLNGLGPIVVAIIVARVIKASYMVKSMILTQTWFLGIILQSLIMNIFVEKQVQPLNLALSFIGLIVLVVYINRLSKQSKDMLKWTHYVSICEAIYILILLVMLILNKAITLDYVSIISILVIGISSVVWWFKFRRHIKEQINITR